MRRRFINLFQVIVLALFVSAQNYQYHSSSQSQKSILGKWSNKIVVPPSTDVYFNVITFTGEPSKGSFVDQNNHTGSWTLEGDSVKWVYENVPDLDNTFAGKLSEDGKSITGINYGVWQGDQFKGSWEATLIE